MQPALPQKEIILNCMPPSTVGSPSAALSILKAYLCKHGHSVRVIYWNILLHHLENEFTWNKCQNTRGASTLIYAAYLAVKTQNDSLYKEVKAALQTILPVMLNEKDFFDEHIKEYSEKLEIFMDDYLDSFDYNNILYFGFSVNMNQWILASVIAEKIKQKKPDLPIVIGGISTDEIAKAFLDNFKQFDIAIWGECEVHLENLAQYLSNTACFSEFNVERAYYRENDMVKLSPIRKHLFLDLNESELYQDVSDYFDYWKQLEIEAPIVFIDIEGSRGCHWNRCRFCYINKGYKFRLKSVEKISKEVKYLISTYGVFHYRFCGNDLIGNDINRFNFLLDELIKIKIDSPKFSIISAEIITSKLSYDTVKKMREAGFINIQVGFESTSARLLKKINKKNTFATNLNAIKHCNNVGINVLGANVIYNLLDETEEDIYEATENLRLYRFFFNNMNKIIINPVFLLINSSSMYFKIHSDKLHEYLPQSYLFYKAFANIIDEETKWHFFEFSKNHKNPLWDYFEDLHYHYTNNNYEYKFIHETEKIIYQEFLNNEMTEYVEFGQNELYIPILDYCYDKPITINELQNLFSKNNRNCRDIETLVDKVDILFHQGLLYRTPDYTEIVSIVNINKTEL